MAVPFAAVITMTLAASSTVALTVMRRVHIAVPAILYEVDRLAAGVVPAAMLAPVLRVTRGYAQVDRLAYHTHRHGLDDNRLRVDQLWPREVTDVDAAVKAGFADLDGYANVAAKCRAGYDCR